MQSDFKDTHNLDSAQELYPDLPGLVDAGEAEGDILVNILPRTPFYLESQTVFIKSIKLAIRHLACNLKTPLAKDEELVTNISAKYIYIMRRKTPREAIPARAR
jgi:hypothetical protein